MIKEVTAYKVRGNLYLSKEEAKYADLKDDFKKLLKEQEYSFKGVNEFYSWFEKHFSTFENLINSYCRKNKVIYGNKWRELI